MTSHVMADVPADVEIRPLGPDDDPEAQLDLAERAFGVIPAAQRDDRRPARAADLRRVGPEDAAAVTAVLGQVHEAARDCGPITRDAAMVAEWLAGRDVYAYLAGDGFLAYRWQHHDLFVERAEAVA